MNVRDSWHYFPILLLCVQFCFAASGPGAKAFSDWIGRCFGSKASESAVTEADFSAVVEFLSPSNSPVSAEELNVPNLSSAELAQIREIIRDDFKGGNFLNYGSPSLRQQIIHLAKSTPEAAKVIQIPITEGNEVVTTNVPMSRAVLEQAMRLSEEKIADIETRTKYFRNELYAEKRIRLTADLFGSVCLGASEEALGTWMSSPRPNPDFTRQKKVLAPLENEINKIIMPCGIFVDVDRGYLAAVPDGIVEKNAIVKLHVLNRPGSDASRYKWKKGKDLAPDKPLYYEVQGLLAITRKELCYLIIVTKESMQHVKVKREEAFWQNKMLEKLDSFYFSVLQPRISNNKLPGAVSLKVGDAIMTNTDGVSNDKMGAANAIEKFASVANDNINDIRKAAGILHVLTTQFSHKHAQDIMRMTQRGSFDTLKLESRIRLLAKDFYIIMDDTKLMKTKVREILQSYYQRKEDWESERDSKIAFVRRYANKHNYDVEMGGLIIDRTNRFLAALPAAIGHRTGKQPGTEQNIPSVREEQISQDGQSVTAVPNGRSRYFGLGNKGRQSKRGDVLIKKVPTQFFRTVSNLGSSKAGQATDTAEDVIFEVVTPEELEAAKGLPPGSEVDSAKKGTRNYYKIQGSLAISRVKTCIFVVAYPGKKEYIEKIEFNQGAWDKMLQKLKHFYYSVYLIHHAAPKEFDRMFRGPTLSEAMGWP